eukprot:m.489432 g.489432  ORF g.489432 m.489432 type:complete len:820 (+) comp21768_c0_seq2:262-2721(+)
MTNTEKKLQESLLPSEIENDAPGELYTIDSQRDINSGRMSRSYPSVPNENDFTSEELEIFRHAGIYIKEGALYLHFVHHPHEPEQVASYLFVHSQKYCLLELFVAIVFLLLVMIEYPAVWDVPQGIPDTINVLCMAFFIFNAYLRGRAFGDKISLRTHPHFITRLIVIGVLLIDMGLSIAYPTYPRFLRVLRVIPILDPEYATGVRRVNRQIVETTFHIVDMLVLLVLYILLWSVLGFYFFGSNTNDPYFRTLGVSYVSLFTLMTTANFPDVMMPAYYENEFACVFFIMYMLIGFFFLMNIVLAMVYEGFTDTEKRKFKKIFKHRREGLRLAWDCAMHRQREASMDFKTFYMICKFYDDSLTKKHIYLAYRALDQDINSGISFEEFQEFYDVLDVKYELFAGSESDSFSLRWWGGFKNGTRDAFEQLTTIVEHKYFEYTIDLIILANTLYVVVQAAEQEPQNSTYVNEHESDKTKTGEWVFFSIYLTEAFLKMLAAGIRGYFRDSWNVFDFTVVFSSMVGIIIQDSTTSTKSAQVTVFIRSLRLLRLVKVRQSFRNVVSGMAYLIPKTGRFLAALIIMFYVFAVVGMGCFNNTVSKCSPFSGVACQTAAAEAACLADPAGGLCVNNTAFQCAPQGYNCGSEYAILKPAYAIVNEPHNNVAGIYQLNNFDNVLRSFVTLFEQMIVNNWFVAMNGHVYMTNEWARVYFMVFFLFTVNVVSNIIIAFIIDSFMGVFPLLKRRGKDGGTGWNRAYRQQVRIQIEEAQHIFSSADTDVFQPVPELVYKASTAIRGADIDRILFADDMEAWLQEEEDDASGSSDA